MQRFTFLFGLIVLVFLASLSVAGIPKMINYQGMLTQSDGKTPVTNANYPILFSIYNISSGGSSLWSHTYNVAVTNGLFNIILGDSGAPINLSFDVDYWLELKVGADPPLSPRIKLTSVGYAYRAQVADSALVTTPGSGSNWYVSNSVLYTNNLWGIARGGAGDVIRGGYPQNAVNLGVACTTGTSGDLWGYQTVSGGLLNTASGDVATIGGGSYNTAGGYATVSGGNGNIASAGYATIGGGIYNIATAVYSTVGGGEWDTASGEVATVGGGVGNKASGDVATVGGGWGNKASGDVATVGGGWGNVASGKWATIPGGWGNIAQGNFSLACGQRAYATHSSAFVWADSTDDYFYSQGVNTFNIRATGGVYSISNNSIYGARFENEGNGDGIRSYANASSGNDWGAIYAINTGSSPAIYGRNDGTGKAAYFYGDIEVTGTINKGALGFKIDHPLYPENKYLHHSGVESPDMKNVYDGVVILDGNGEAWVELPEWFETLNRDFRYQLTSIGAPGPNLYIAEKITSNRFKIAGGQPGMEVSWQVTGIRKDPFAEKHRIPVEEEKPANERGKYLHPDAYNLPETMGINYSDKEKGK